MRVSFASLTVTAPTQGFVERGHRPRRRRAACSTPSSPGVPRPFREPGIQVPDPLPAGAPAAIPRFDANPERAARRQRRAARRHRRLDVPAGAVVTGLVGVARLRLPHLHDPAGRRTRATVASVADVAAAGPRPRRRRDESTVASFNLERFFDTSNDAGVERRRADRRRRSTTRLAKASRAIRDVAAPRPTSSASSRWRTWRRCRRWPPRIGADAVAGRRCRIPATRRTSPRATTSAASTSGFLVKTAPSPSACRGRRAASSRKGWTTTYINPNTGQPEILNDRPPLVGEFVVHYADGRALPLTVIVNHLRSLNDVADETPQGPGRSAHASAPSARAQAEYLAGLVQARLTARPGRAPRARSATSTPSSSATASST